MDRTAVREGVKTALPLLPGIVPFALVAGVTAADVGLSLPQAVGLSVIVFAGASQLAALELLGENSPLLVVVATAAIINLRLVMYSASIAPHFRTLPARLKALASYVLTDQAFALSVAKYAESPDIGKVGYYLGISAALWIAWQVGTVAGVLLGTGVPASWGLSFAVPLVFLAILVPAVTDRATATSAAVGGGIALAGSGLPFNLGLIVGAIAGVAAGVIAESALGVDPSAEVDRGH
jgi:4-azaleucine resistance transporter AzlC